MWNSKMYWQNKGVVRLVFVVSIIASILGFCFYVEFMDNPYISNADYFGYAITTGCVCFVVVWIIYFAVVWIIEGFHNKDDTKE